MPSHNVVHHTCRRPEDDDGLPFSPHSCRCESKISLKEARCLVSKGLAAWKRQRNSNGYIVESKAAVVARRREVARRRSEASTTEAKAVFEMLQARGYEADITLPDFIDLVERRSPYGWL